MFFLRLDSDEDDIRTHAEALAGFLLMLDTWYARHLPETPKTYMTLGIIPTALETHLGPQRMNLDEDPVSFLSAIPHDKKS